MVEYSGGRREAQKSQTQHSQGKTAMADNNWSQSVYPENEEPFPVWIKGSGMGMGCLQEERNLLLDELVLVWEDKLLGVECRTVAVNTRPFRRIRVGLVRREM